MALACALLVAFTMTDSPRAEARPPADTTAILQIHPGGGPARFGDQQTLEADVSLPSGAGLAGVEVDFEVTVGPGDQDGNTPQTPDMTCTTAGGDAHHAATCSVSYSEPANQDGSDAVLAWIDADNDDSTVEADLGEGENENAPGSGPCAPGAKGPGNTPEPDITDCVEKRWQARRATTVDFEPKGSSGLIGSEVNLAATVLDQFGAPIGAAGVAPVTVSFELLAGSAHDPGDGTDFSSPDLGSCVTGADGACSIPFTATSVGTDIICAYIAGASASCDHTPDAAGAAAGAQVITRAWQSSAPASTDQAATNPPPSPPPSDSQPPAARHSKPKEHASAPSEDGNNSSREAPTSSRPQTRSNDSHRSAVRPARHARRRLHAHRVAAGHHRRPHAMLWRPAHLRPEAAADAPRLKLHAGTRRHRRPAARTIADLSRAALITAHKLSFPLGLALLVVFFLAIQGRLDRRDPKLRLAPIDSKHDTLPFA